MQERRVQSESTPDSEFQIETDGCLLFRGRVCVPKSLELIQKILNEAYNGNMSMHPGSNKVYNPVTIPEWKWERITMDFVSGLPLSPKKKDVIWIEILGLHLDSRASCKKLWFEGNWERYRSDPSHVISSTELEIQPDMTYGEEPIKILARETKELRNKKVALVKVLWQRHSIEEAT
ncbi:integrase [Gossypium australe]|uniref:Integrase n=1 Tax=Gossypium australe TaxID=47621 RepID=A0A5B6V978_9ROSI|nr:integrase [Gossypium australe]